MYETFFNDFTPGFYTLLIPAQEYSNLQITSAEFAEILLKEKNKLSELYQEVENIVPSGEFSDSVSSNKDTGLLGVQTITAAIDHILKYFKTNPASIEEGLNMAKRGYLLVKEALEQSVKNLRVFSDSMEEPDIGGEMIIPSF